MSIPDGSSCLHCINIYLLKNVNAEGQRHPDAYIKYGGCGICKFIYSLMYTITESTNTADQVQMDTDNSNGNGVKNINQKVSTICLYACLLFTIMSS